MATSRLIPLHRNKGKTVLKSLFDRVEYAKNERKTEGGELVKCYECSPQSVEEEFMLAKREYDHINGNKPIEGDVIGYQIRQSFKPGEISPEQALEVGYDLAMRFTKGKHQFVVAVHTDRHHIHSHIIFNSTTLDCTRKFKNFWGSSFALRRLSDIICVENGLSVVENPKPSKGKNYGEWLGSKPPSWSDKIKQKIDEFLPKCKTFDEFLEALKSDGATVRTDKKYISVLLPGQGRPIRLNSLGEQYTESAIHERLSGGRIVKVSSDSGTQTCQPGSGRVSLLIDIQAKIRECKGAGYEQWAKIFNLQQAAKTLIFLQEQGIDSYDDLKKKSSSASGEFAVLTKKIRDTETRMSKVSELQKYIGQYGKTRDVYAAYKKSGWSSKFYDEHTADIILHRAAKKYFDGLGLKKLPSINQLKQDWAALAAEKKKLYSSYHELKETSRSLTLAKGNADRILGISSERENRETQSVETKSKTVEI